MIGQCIVGMIEFDAVNLHFGNGFAHHFAGNLEFPEIGETDSQHNFFTRGQTHGGGDHDPSAAYVDQLDWLIAIGEEAEIKQVDFPNRDADIVSDVTDAHPAIGFERRGRAPIEPSVGSRSNWTEVCHGSRSDQVGIDLSIDLNVTFFN